MRRTFDCLSMVYQREAYIALDLLETCERPDRFLALLVSSLTSATCMLHVFIISLDACACVRACVCACDSPFTMSNRINEQNGVIHKNKIYKQKRSLKLIEPFR